MANQRKALYLLQRRGERMAGSSINKHVSKHVTLPFFFDFWVIESDQSAHAES
jgi:hypothetical protein